ncbi:Pantoate-beta-alanine ligase [Phycomyces blakesleeanus]|uniref:Pantoate--beta-alanine ligase n=2 Tax=Phycomyces blakesleeanus TaxID=4837 RepID=A0A162PVP5_PHYB8|nr:hypothetical protein PHYBLDRAFT_180675 [Phycomyces blakesleeanus NRRL 1555(-)]OAD76437.1 hypothetical protein PHYBLDRAFT_180675 [Phycomyces blakesleeanus NRRL 1555(-)]|eukprot:XP_018294477.1 hypothetical protein PHYBLDRAFT_180675 [Phycomyces blakesleeanus NRRL 1555(-)]
MASAIKIPPGIRLFNKIADFRQWRREILLDRKTLGYVPTMGALHKGHLALVSTAKSHCDHVALTIFVNPAQFAPHEDLSSYPRTLQADLDKLASLGPGVASAVLVPQVEEMYPAGIDLDVSKQKGTFVEVKGISEILEGKTRPAFFRGVTTVVSKFFNIVQPDNAFFGQKDIQQCYVIKSMIRDMHFPIKLEICPTTREEDGLAMSSRNTYLTPSQRAHALVLYNALKKMEKLYAAGEHNVSSLIKAAHAVVEEERQKVKKLNEGWEIKLDYISINDKSDLSEVGDKLKEGGCVMSGAVYVGKTRLIDNLLVN